MRNSNYRLLLYIVLLISFSLLMIALSCSNPTDPVDTTDPQISITNPSDGDTLPKIFDITAAATDNEEVAKVEFYIDNQLLYTDSLTPWSYNWSTIDYADSGQHTIQVKAYDAAGNTGNSSVITITLENLAPAAITDLTVTDFTKTSVTLTWTSPGDDGNTGTAIEYDIRMYVTTITESNWNSGTKIPNPPTPQAAGNSESIDITGLDLSTVYYFAVRAKDKIGNMSDVSNNVSVTTESLFKGPTNYDVGSKPEDVFAVDMDNDTDYDLVVANTQSDDISILLNNGDGTFQSAINIAVGLSLSSVFPADFNGDGIIDLAITNDTANSFKVLINDGALSFQQISEITFDSTWLKCTGFYIGGECLFGELIESTPADFDSLNVDTFILNIIGNNPSSVFSADYDGNGFDDLAITNLSSDNISIRLNKGDETFWSQDYDSLWFVCQGYDTSGACTLWNSFTTIPIDSIFDSLNVDTFDFTYNTDKAPSSIFSADFDGDGSYDLVTTNDNSSNVSVFLNYGDGTFQNAVGYDVDDNSAIDNKPASVISDDINSDGYLDIVVANENSSNISILYNKGDGTFQNAVNYNAGNGPKSVFAADFYNDGYKDLVVVNRIDDNISVMKNNDRFTFWSWKTINFDVGKNPNSVYSADLDNDGDKDLIVTNQLSDNVSIFLNTIIE
ncbi:MAG: FG-GAP-like repeat-containing protein [Candidatus Zixiibacteriota bacterium]